MSETYRNELGTEIEIVAQRGEYLWIETQLENGDTDRGRIKTTDKFALVNAGTWEPIGSSY